MRVTRIAAGGPERLPSDDSMKGSKGGCKNGSKKGGEDSLGKDSWKGYSLNGYTWIPIA